MNKISKIENIMIFIIFIPLLFIDRTHFGVDIFWLLKHGKIIIEQGFINTVPLTIHNDLNFVMQQWLSSTILYNLSNILGEIGIYLYIYLFSLINILLIYKILSEISQNKNTNICLTFVFSILFCIRYAFARPQLISYTIILLTLLLCEKYVKTNKIKYLIPIPFLAIIQINAHATMWVYMFCILGIYIFNLKIFKTKNLIDDIYNKIPIIITFIISLFCLFINPYKVDMILYVFKSNSSLLQYISAEMQPSSLSNEGIILFLILFIIAILLYKLKSKIKLRFLILLLGGTILSLLNVRNLIMFLIATTIFLSYFIKDIDSEKIMEKIFGVYNITIPIIIIFAFIIRFINIQNFSTDCNIEKNINIKNIANIILTDKDYTENSTVYNSTQSIGSLLEEYNINVYMDTRGEIYLESINNKKDILNEYLMLEYFGRIDVNTFLEEYNFDYLVLHDTSVVKDYTDKYKLIFVENNENNTLIYLYKKL